MVNSYRVCAEFFNMGFFDFFVVDFLFFYYECGPVLVIMNG